MRSQISGYLTQIAFTEGRSSVGTCWPPPNRLAPYDSRLGAEGQLAHDQALAGGRAGWTSPVSEAATTTRSRNSSSRADALVKQARES